MRVEDGSGNEIEISKPIAEAAQNNVRFAFSQDVSAPMLIRLSEIEQALTDNQINAVQREKKPHIACKKGCAWCCIAYVCATTIEVLHLAAWMQENFTPEELEATKQRVADVAQKRANLPWQAQEQLRIYCPLLVDNACSVYPVRPLACRGFCTNSSDPCRHNATSPDGSQIPMLYYTPFKAIASSVRVGIQAALDEMPFQNDNLELVQALNVALNTPDILERWLSGERVFPESTFQEK